MSINILSDHETGEASSSILAFIFLTAAVLTMHVAYIVSMQNYTSRKLIIPRQQ